MARPVLMLLTASLVYALLVTLEFCVKQTSTNVSLLLVCLVVFVLML
jgi:hypothetical protein